MIPCEVFVIPGGPQAAYYSGRPASRLLFRAARKPLVIPGGPQAATPLFS